MSLLRCVVVWWVGREGEKGVGECRVRDVVEGHCMHACVGVCAAEETTEGEGQGNKPVNSKAHKGTLLWPHTRGQHHALHRAAKGSAAGSQAPPFDGSRWIIAKKKTEGGRLA